MRSFVVIAALSLVLGSAPSFAQGTTTRRRHAAGAAAAPPPRPRPSPRRRARSRRAPSSPSSTSSASRRNRPRARRPPRKVQALNQQKVTQLNDLNKKLQADQAEAAVADTVLNEAARGAARARHRPAAEGDPALHAGRAGRSAAAPAGPAERVPGPSCCPIIQQVVAERGLAILFSQTDSGIVWADPALDLTADVIKRFDAAAPARHEHRRPRPRRLRPRRRRPRPRRAPAGQAAGWSCEAARRRAGAEAAAAANGQ